MAMLLFLALKLYIPKLPCICCHTGVRKVEQIKEEDVVFRSQVTQSLATSNRI